MMCTLTSAYLAPVMADQRFDVLIAEEAGMATLPSLFHAACLCTRRAIMVGDPQQLPPIVQSNDARVRRAIGRNVFEVAVGDPTRSALVAMLDVQYRMHPAIGALVGALFYGGRLRHGADRAATDAIAARPPFPGMPVVVVDTRARTTCQRSARGSSRVNPGAAEITADLAAEAVRGGAASVAVITPYAAQAADIRRLLAARRIGDAVECSTIHRFQGRECDVVILDLVDAAPMRPSALLASAPNLLNVSISRPRQARHRRRRRILRGGGARRHRGRHAARGALSGSRRGSAASAGQPVSTAAVTAAVGAWSTRTRARTASRPYRRRARTTDRHRAPAPGSPARA
ncbi:MAG: hypothetical protein E6J90_41120 [Deltaproteobacteria bacterium]|nr:MAG: hypothetical protein E6J90_41120 [Deltaproteobacteria bacterium]